MTRPDGLQRLIDLGVTPETPLADLRGIKLTNAVSLIGILATSGWITISTIADINVLYALAASLVAFAAVLGLNAAGRYFAAQLTFAAVPLLITAAQAFNLGLSAGIHFYLLPIAFVPFFLFSRDRVRFALASSSVASAFFCAIAWTWSPAHPLVDSALFSFSLASSAVAITVIGAYARALALASEAQMDQQRRDNQALIRDVLPARIAERLLTGVSSAIEVYDDAVILHADIAGFTPLAESMAPEELVSLLDDLISAFDEVCARHRVEKLKTVGDAYIAAAGVPDRQPDAAERALAAAVDILAAARAVRERRGLALELRVGVACGTVAAGIVGKQRYSLELCGEALDRAEALQQSGRAGVILVDARTRARAHTRTFAAEAEDNFSLVP